MLLVAGLLGFSPSSFPPVSPGADSVIVFSLLPSLGFPSRGGMFLFTLRIVISFCVFSSLARRGGLQVRPQFIPYVLSISSSDSHVSSPSFAGVPGFSPLCAFLIAASSSFFQAFATFFVFSRSLAAFWRLTSMFSSWGLTLSLIGRFS